MSENLVIITRPTDNGSLEVLTGEKQRGAFAGKTVFPGGKMERRESPDDAAIREVAEETGITLDKIRIMGSLSVNHRRYVDDWNDNHWRSVRLYGAEVPAGTEASDTAELVNTWRPLDDETLADNMPADVRVWWEFVRDKLPDAGWDQVYVTVLHEEDGSSTVQVRYPDFATEPNKILRRETLPPTA
jgi:8-oxo-dGTP pyrophosphatase MutT (NUDIX family)